MDIRILFPYPDPHEAITLGTTLLKEGYSLSLDDVYDHANYTQTVAVLTIYKNEEIVKRMKLRTGDYIYYNKTIDGKEYTIIESKLDTIFRGTPNNMVMLRPFYQYSDGSNIIEPDFVSANLNPKTTETPYEEWNRRFGGIYDDNVWSVQRTSDDGYILGGTIKSQNPEGPPMYVDIPLLIKVDANGNEIWEKTFGLDGFDSVNSVLQTSDGGYVLAGIIDTAKNPDHKGQILYEDHDAWLFKTDATGNIEWSKTIGGLKGDEAKFVQQAPDGGYVIAGTTESYGSGGSEMAD